MPLYLTAMMDSEEFMIIYNGINQQGGWSTLSTTKSFLKISELESRLYSLIQLPNSVLWSCQMTRDSWQLLKESLTILETV